MNGKCKAFVKTEVIPASAIKEHGEWIQIPSSLRRLYKTVDCAPTQTELQGVVSTKKYFGMNIDSEVVIQTPVNSGKTLVLTQGCFFDELSHREAPPTRLLGEIEGTVAKSGLYEFRFSLNQFAQCKHNFLNVITKQDGKRIVRIMPL